MRPHSSCLRRNEQWETSSKVWGEVRRSGSRCARTWWRWEPFQGRAGPRLSCVRALVSPLLMRSGWVQPSADPVRSEFKPSNLAFDPVLLLSLERFGTLSWWGRTLGSEICSCKNSQKRCPEEARPFPLCYGHASLIPEWTCPPPSQSPTWKRCGASAPRPSENP